MNGETFMLIKILIFSTPMSSSSELKNVWDRALYFTIYITLIVKGHCPSVHFSLLMFILDKFLH